VRRQSQLSNPNTQPRALRAALVTLAVAAALLSAGCGAVSHISSSVATPANLAHGKTLFQMTTLPGGKPGCGSCHTLADAGTKGIIGPNLDEAFRYDKCQGFKVSTIRDVVRGQIAYATAATGVAQNYSGRDVNAGPGTGMPDNLLQGQDAKDVAVYVAQVAGNGGCPTYPSK
jgi:cytochrome c2